MACFAALKIENQIGGRGHRSKKSSGYRKNCRKRRGTFGVFEDSFRERQMKPRKAGEYLAEFTNKKWIDRKRAQPFYKKVGAIVQQFYKSRQKFDTASNKISQY